MTGRADGRGSASVTVRRAHPDDLDALEHHDRMLAVVHVSRLHVPGGELDEHVQLTAFAVLTQHLDLHAFSERQHIDIVLPVPIGSVYRRESFREMLLALK